MDPIPMFALSIGDEEVEAVVEVLRSGWLSQGPKVEEFERSFAESVGTKFAVAVSSCTAALHLALAEIGVSVGDEVVTTPMTFVATVNSIVYQGAKPVFADINPKTLNIDPEKVIDRVTERTKAIVPVHYAGEPAEMGPITEIAEDHGLFVIEDSAHAPGATYHGRMAGSIGDFGCFSFYPNKNITTGDGGMITLNDRERARRLRLMRSHGMDRSACHREVAGLWEYGVGTLGFSYRMNELQAALGIVQLNRLGEITKKRRRNAERFIKAVQPFEELEVQHVPEGVTHAYHFCPLSVESEELSRDHLLTRLRHSGVSARVHYRPVYLFEYFQEKFGNHAGSCPVAEEKYRKLMSIPCHQQLTTDQMDAIADLLGKIISEDKKS